MYLFTKLDELKSSITGPFQMTPINLITEALKQNTAALNILQTEVASLRTSAVTKEELKTALTAIEGQTSAVTQMKANIISEAGKFVSDIAAAGYCDTSKLKEDIKGIVERALMTCPRSSSSAEGEVSVLATRDDFMALSDKRTKGTSSEPN